MMPKRSWLSNGKVSCGFMNCATCNKVVVFRLPKRYKSAYFSILFAKPAQNVRKNVFPPRLGIDKTVFELYNPFFVVPA